MKGVFYLQSFYSIMQSVNSLESLVKKAKENHYDFVALSDHHNLYGMVEFFTLCHQYKIKPVIGMKITLDLKNIITAIPQVSFLIYALNDQGIRHLIQISNLLQIQNRPITLKELSFFQNNLFVILSNIDCFFDNLLKSNVFQQVIQKLKEYCQHFYFGLSLQSDELEMFTEILLQWVALYKIKIVPTHQTKYLTEAEMPVYKIMAQLTNQHTILRKIQNHNLSFQFLTIEQKDKLYQVYYQNYSQMFLNLSELISSIQYQYVGLKSFRIPVFSPNNNINSFDYLKQKTHQALESKLFVGSRIPITYRQRLEKELQIIHDMDYADYFLIVSDIVCFAKNKGILVGPGRGSSSSSLICFLLDITEIDPLVYHLLFERFLNPQRRKKPDIDLDFPDDQIKTVLQYIVHKYGAAYVASIITFNTWTAKSFLRMIPELQKKVFFEQFLDKIDLDSIAHQIEGIPRFTGKHSAGLIISNKNLFTSLPVQRNQQTHLPCLYQTQFDAKQLENIGLLKIDVLSLKNLSLVNKILNKIKNSISFSWHRIPLDDLPTYKNLQKAQTDYIFQLESFSAKEVLKKVKPCNFNDLVAVLALNRPGPKNYINHYCLNKQNQNFTYLHPHVDIVLKNTYGIILYQEQIMEIAVRFAGYNLGESEILMTKLSQNKTIQQKALKIFVDKSVKQGHSIFLANRVFNYILQFSKYSFNKSHSVSYSLISYRMAYLKTHHFVPFFMVFLDEYQKNLLETAKLFKQMKKEYKLNFLLPNLFLSSINYRFVNNSFLLPLTFVPGMNEEISLFIIKERQKKQFVDFFDFKKRCRFVLNSSLLKNLIWMSVFDDFGLTKKDLMQQADLENFEHEQYLLSSRKDSFLYFNTREEYQFLQIKEQVYRILGFDLYDILSFKHSR
ncbi:PHP domain-containing protein [Candidatus Phytoplasma phoenicium]|uniref:DNA-directed DNA polymerase n=1 Tax=Candidatus Phytoplasma phoenicium TaxID=198422 RepID=A0A0L0MJT8_9MOLU|nr:PHP domain-containing protein [Candidatus Phytoplasma phoenicium]KND62541.1 DNA polymerase III alpha subunit [Candidatus Phytoplasma phoenicium]